MTDPQASSMRRRVIAFGSFDPLHEGHIHFLRQAKALGDFLLVVVAHDSAIRAQKHREPYQSEAERLAAVSALDFVDEAMIGRETADKYHLLGELDFDVVVLGYDQEPSDDVVREQLDARGKHQVQAVRLEPYKPEQYKSTLIRKQDTDTSSSNG